jgi:hypothetical protein
VDRSCLYIGIALWNDRKGGKIGNGSLQKWLRKQNPYAITVLLLVSKFTACWQAKAQMEPSDMGQSSYRNKDGIDESQTHIEDIARKIYKLHISNATDALVKFLATIDSGESALCVTYFDEADELGLHFWVLLRLLSNQDELTAMWYVFMATKSNVTYFNPIVEKSESSIFSSA